MSRRKSTKPPSSRDLVPVGPRHVQISQHGKRDQNGLKPSTSRALVLRNGKYGARGTGELMLAGRITGREKLDLLAGTSSSLLSCPIRRPFPQRTSYFRNHVLPLWRPSNWTSASRLPTRNTMVHTQAHPSILFSHPHPLPAYLDDIADLKDPDSFYAMIITELLARSPHTKDGQQHIRNASHIASVVSTRYRFSSLYLHTSHLPLGYTMPTWSPQDGNSSSTSSATCRIWV